MKSSSKKAQVASLFALICPVVALWLTKAWANLIANQLVSADGSYIPPPIWWHRLGLEHQPWTVGAGFIPGLLCGVCGFVIAVAGGQLGSWMTIRCGLCALFAAPVICLLYLAATF